VERILVLNRSEAYAFPGEGEIHFSSKIAVTARYVCCLACTKGENLYFERVEEISRPIRQPCCYLQR